MSTQSVAKAVEVNGRNVTLALDADLWERLARIARGEGRTVPELLSAIDGRRKTGDTLSLPAAVRVFVAGYERASPDQGA